MTHVKTGATNIYIEVKTSIAARKRKTQDGRSLHRPPEMDVGGNPAGENLLIKNLRGKQLNPQRSSVDRFNKPNGGNVYELSNQIMPGKVSGGAVNCLFHIFVFEIIYIVLVIVCKLVCIQEHMHTQCKHQSSTFF